MAGRAISFLGTGSDVGKSFVVAAACRALQKRGVRVAPFKAQNMSNNSFVTLEGLEMGRAQVVQAEAAGLEPHVDMNPVLLKPSADCTSQVVLHGKVLGQRHAREYFSSKESLFSPAMASLDRLLADYDAVVMEGAGSCSEVNLRDRDIVNFPAAHHANAPVVLVADIDRGGVFAQVVGTLEVIPPADKARISAILINRFRGDIRLFDDGVKWIEERTGLPVIGVLPFSRDIAIDSEDGMAVEAIIDPTGRVPTKDCTFAVPLLPRISNHTDMAALQCTPGFTVHYLSRPRDLSPYDYVILPGSKNVRADMTWLVDTGWDTAIHDFHANGGRIGGICGGYQMLGKWIDDPHGVEGRAGNCPGLGLLPIHTTLTTEKTLRRCTGTWTDGAVSVEGYEIHMGVSKIVDDANLQAALTGLQDQEGNVFAVQDGLRSLDGRVWGCYLHGLFDSGAFRTYLIQGLRGECDVDFEDFSEFKSKQYDLLGKHFERHIDVPRLLSLCGIP